MRILEETQQRLSYLWADGKYAAVGKRPFAANYKRMAAEKKRMMAGERSNVTSKRRATVNEKKIPRWERGIQQQKEEMQQKMGGGRQWERGSRQQTERMPRRERRMPRWAGGGLWRKRRMPQWMKGVTQRTKGIAQREGKMPRRKGGCDRKRKGCRSGRAARHGRKEACSGGREQRIYQRFISFFRENGRRAGHFSFVLFTFARKHRTLGASKVLAGIKNSPHFTHKIDIKPHNLMKRTHTFQLKALTFLLLSFCFLTAQAQRKFRFGLGINYALPIERYTSGETRLGVYLNGTYRLADRLDVA